MLTLARSSFKLFAHSPSCQRTWTMSPFRVVVKHFLSFAKSDSLFSDPLIKHNYSIFKFVGTPGIAGLPEVLPME